MKKGKYDIAKLSNLDLLTEYDFAEGSFQQLSGARRTCDAPAWRVPELGGPYGSVQKAVSDVTQEVFLWREDLRHELDRRLGIEEEDYDD